MVKKNIGADGKVETYKSRLVAKGYRQQEGIDYDETFSPVAMLKSIWILLAIAAYYDYEIWKGKKPSLKHIKVWGCPSYVKRLQTNKLEARSDKCRFIDYPKETMGYYFYQPSNHKVFVEEKLIQFGVVDVYTDQS